MVEYLTIMVTWMQQTDKIDFMIAKASVANLSGVQGLGGTLCGNPGDLGYLEKPPELNPSFPLALEEGSP